MIIISDYVIINGTCQKFLNFKPKMTTEEPNIILSEVRPFTTYIRHIDYNFVCNQTQTRMICLFCFTDEQQYAG